MNYVMPFGCQLNSDHPSVQPVTLADDEVSLLQLIYDASHGSTRQSYLSADGAGCHYILLQY